MDTLLKTKLFVPQLSNRIVTRQHLVDWLNLEGGKKLTVLSAPPGYGKSTLLYEWVHKIEHPVAYLALDDADNDLYRFIKYLIAAFQTIEPELAKNCLPQVQDPNNIQINEILTSLINEVSSFRSRILLVMDDYHAITSEAIHDAVVFLLTNLPTTLNVAIATRIDPPFRLAQFRAQGDLCEVRAENLRFNYEETVAFIQLLEIGLSSADTATLFAKTDGWIAGLQLAAISLRDHPERHAFISNFAGDDRHIADYLIEEALHSQPPHIEDFLLKTSILERLCPPLCNLVAEREDSHKILDYLERINLFLIPMDRRRYWYRYHHLFSELLRFRLQQKKTDETKVLYRRASSWYASEGMRSQAIAYALEGNDIYEVSKLVEQHIFSLVDMLELYGLLNLFNQISDDYIHSQPWLALTKAWTLAFTGQFESIEPLLKKAQQNLIGFDEVDTQRILGRVFSLQAYVTGSIGDRFGCIQYAQRALGILPQDDLVVRSFTLSLLGNAFVFRGYLTSALGAYKKALSLIEPTDENHMMVMVLTRLAAVQKMMGNLNLAQETCQRALDLSDAYHQKTQQHLLVSGFTKIRMASILHERNDLEQAHQYIQDGLELTKRWGNYAVLSLGYRNYAKILRSMGNKEGALEKFQHLPKIPSNTVKAYLDSHTTEMAIRLSYGELEWVNQFDLPNILSVDDDIEFEFIDLYQVYSRMLITQGENSKAKHLLDRLLILVDQAKAAEKQIALQVSKVYLHARLGEMDQAIVVLEQVLSLAEPEGYMHVFIDEGVLMAQLLYKAALQGISSNYCYQLLEQFSETERPTADRSTNLIEPLSNREIEVLKLIAEGCSNQEIAGNLFISLHTVKYHAHNIFGKLGVKNRTEAVSKAQLLGII